MLKTIEILTRVVLMSSLLALLVLPVAAKTTTAAPPPENLDIHDEAPKKETILDLIFGSDVQMPTERGILVIDAFEDLNMNGVQDSGEPTLSNEISCNIDKVDYSVPAFIPGLDYNNRYKVRCSGERYALYSPPADVFIERRGHVIEISLPCKKVKD